jgi:hypothetical protein
MKRWSRYLLRFLLWSGISMTVLILFFCFHLWLYVNSGCGYCSRAVSPQQGNFRAVMIGMCCDGGCRDMVVLRRVDGWWFDTKIFVYQPLHGFPEPVITWLSPNELQIAVKSVADIYTQKTEARGIRITYQIGYPGHP